MINIDFINGKYRVTAKDDIKFFSDFQQVKIYIGNILEDKELIESFRVFLHNELKNFMKSSNLHELLSRKIIINSQLSQIFSEELTKVYAEWQNT